MRLVVIGGSGTLGRAVAERAVSSGHDVTVVSRNVPSRLTVGATHRAADVTTGEGLAKALEGADAIIDACNSLADAESVLVGGTKHVLAAARESGVRHFVGVSIVGIDGAPVGYYRAKVAQERTIAEGGVPWSLVRATQFHELVAWLASGKHGVVLAPIGWSLQPIDVRDVAPALVAAAEAEPAGRLPDLAGPEVRPFRELALSWQRARCKKRLIVPVPIPGKTGRFLRSGAMCNPDRAVGAITFADWLGGGSPRGSNPERGGV